jgi:two-component system, chemotaxis family, chemotaxis protein CheY
MRALVVDDSKTVRLLVGRILRGLGFDISEAGDGVEALAKLADGSFELCMIDWNMPNMNGYELVRAVRQNADWNETRLVMCTTESDLSNVQAALAAGADEYVMKPFTADMITDKLLMLGFES